MPRPDPAAGARRMRARIGLLALLAWLPLALAQDARSQADRPRQSLRPTGPITINADSAEWEKGGLMVYSGKVRLDSGELKLAGDQLEMRQYGDGQFEARVTGTPATLDHSGVPGDDGRRAEPVSARAGTLVYDTRSEVVEVQGDAVLTRGSGNRITGQTIRYDVARRRVQADGGDNGQVTIVLEPPPPRDGTAAPEPPQPSPSDAQAQPPASP